ncbi:MAG TPA: hypothetical protein VGZ47_11400 [Gemmataceae bacterium]|jgi:hypothetical protein|nr:hypothetical protein [Gemmataceae bacterium]
MRHTLLVLPVLISLGITTLSPDHAQAGPFGRRGRAWAQNSYYLSPSRDNPGAPAGYPAYSYPGAYGAYSSIPWSVSSPGHDDAQAAPAYRPYYYAYPSIPWTETSPGHDDTPAATGYGTYYYSPPNFSTIPWKDSSPSRDDPE